MSDNVSHPAHYNAGRVEVIEFIEDQRFNYHRGNAVKYICRAGKKSEKTEIEDLRKAIWYLEREIELIQAIKEVRPVTRPNDMRSRSSSAIAVSNLVESDGPTGIAGGAQGVVDGRH